MKNQRSIVSQEDAHSAARFAEQLRKSSAQVSEALTSDVGMHAHEACGSVNKLCMTLDDLIALWTRTGSFPAYSRGHMFGPVGRVAIRTPASYPLSNGAWALAPALLAGNSISWLFPPECVYTRSVMQSILRSSGCDSRVELLDPSNDEATVLASGEPDFLVYVGSRYGARTVLEKGKVREVGRILETGGVNLHVASEESEPESVAKTVLCGILRHSGQCCNKPTHFAVPSTGMQEFLAACADQLHSTSGKVLESIQVLRPLATRRYANGYDVYRASVESLVERVLSPARWPEGAPRPFVGHTTRLDARLAPLEAIGPGVILFGYESYQELLHLFSDCDIFSLVFHGGSFCSKKLEMASELGSPMLGLNALPSSNAQTRWQGATRSGAGFLLSSESIFQFTKVTPVTESLFPVCKTARPRLGAASLDVFVRECGEETLNAAVEAIEAQYAGQIQIIRNVRPVSDSFNVVLEAASKDYFLIVDADVVIDPEAIPRMVDRMTRLGSDVAIVMPLLWDEFLGEAVYAGLKLYRTSAVAGLKYRDVIDDDHDFNVRLSEEHGRRVFRMREILGRHGIEESPRSAYKRGRVRALKYRLRERRHGVRHGLHKPLVRILERWGRTRDKRDLAFALGSLVSLLAQLDDPGAFSPEEYGDELDLIVKTICKTPLS